MGTILFDADLYRSNVSPVGQTLCVIPHRCDNGQLKVAESIYRSLGSKMVVLKDWLEHDRITANTQAVTHLAFLSMGSAWMAAGSYPWEDSNYIGGIDNVKSLTALRIYSSKYHVYAGLALLNPSARSQISQYSNSTTELFKLMIQEREREFRSRISASFEFVFGGDNSNPILLADKVMDRFALSAIPSDKLKANSHLSLLAIVDAWYCCFVSCFQQ